MPGISLSERICLSWRPRRAAAGDGEAVPFDRKESGGKVLITLVDCSGPGERNSCEIEG